MKFTVTVSADEDGVTVWEFKLDNYVNKNKYIEVN